VALKLGIVETDMPDEFGHHVRRIVILAIFTFILAAILIALTIWRAA
jgi:hypothetical protein